MSENTPRTDALKLPSEIVLLLGSKGVPQKIVEAILALGKHAGDMERELAQAQARLAECERDAERYRFIFQSRGGFPAESISANFNHAWRLWDGESEWDAHIDAMKESRK